MRRGFAVFLAVGSGVLLPAGTAAYATRAGGYGKKPPVSGKWAIINVGPPAATGQFTVASHHEYVSGFTAMPSSVFSDQCGSGPVSLVGHSRIVHYQGINHYKLPFSVWMVGKPAGDGATRPTKVTLSSAGQTLAGKLLLAFTAPRGGRAQGAGPPKSHGELSYTLPGQAKCDLTFEFKKA